MQWEMEKKVIYKSNLAQVLNELSIKLDKEINKMNYQAGDRSSILLLPNQELISPTFKKIMTDRSNMFGLHKDEFIIETESA